METKAVGTNADIASQKLLGNKAMRELDLL